MLESVRRFLKSFIYAINGIELAIKQERNMRFHLCATIYVYGFSLFYSFSRVEYMVLTILIAGVISLELVNSAIERCVYKPDADKYMIAGEVKDMAAGAVLVFSIGAMVCGMALFWDIEVIGNMIRFFSTHWFSLLLLVCSLIISFLFIFKPRKVS